MPEEMRSYKVWWKQGPSCAFNFGGYFTTETTPETRVTKVRNRKGHTVLIYTHPSTPTHAAVDRLISELSGQDIEYVGAFFKAVNMLGEEKMGETDASLPISIPKKYAALFQNNGRKRLMRDEKYRQLVRGKQ